MSKTYKTITLNIDANDHKAIKEYCVMSGISIISAFTPTIKRLVKKSNEKRGNYGTD